MQGVYTASIAITGLAAAKTLMYLVAPSDGVVEILSVSMTNESVATPEQLPVSIHRISSLGTPTATTITPEKSETGSAAASSTVKGNVTASEPTYASTNPIYREGVNNLAGFHYDLNPEERITVGPSAALGIRLLSNPGASFNATVTLTFREIR